MGSSLFQVIPQEGHLRMGISLQEQVHWKLLLGPGWRVGWGREGAVWRAGARPSAEEAEPALWEAGSGVAPA